MKIFFISTNSQWSGSEELWTRSAKLFQTQGFEIAFSASYEHPVLDELVAKKIAYYDKVPSLLVRVLKKLKLLPESDPVRAIQDQLEILQPDVVVISQGNNVDSNEVMTACLRYGKPYVTVTQLVTEFHYLFISEENRSALTEGYRRATRNYFVSRHNLKLNDTMLGLRLSNAEVVFNPCKLKGSSLPAFPYDVTPWSIGLVGRLECYHKGYDLLMEVAAQPKWKERPVCFNLYGDGPHKMLIQSMIDKSNISNVFLKGHVADVKEIWSVNHILLMTSRMEGQALTLIEAMWCGRAAIATDVGGAAELIDDGVNGYIAAFPTVRAIDEAMERAWAVRENWESMGMKSRDILQDRHPIDEAKYLNERILESLDER